MKIKETLVTALALVAIVFVGVVAYRHEVRTPQETCKLCQRPIHAAVAYELDLKDGTREKTCCPRCAMHNQVAQGDQVRRALATDLVSGKMITADSATYVEGGDVIYCTAGEQHERREPQAVAERQFDRCLPTLVAFATRDDAEAYHRQHGGRVLDYAQALESVKAQ